MSALKPEATVSFMMYFSRSLSERDIVIKGLLKHITRKKSEMQKEEELDRNDVEMTPDPS
jgi:hypothetical protein